MSLPECPCWELCAQMVALASAFLGDDAELGDRLATLSRDELVALVMELADGSAWARQAVWERLAKGSA